MRAIIRSCLVYKIATVLLLLLGLFVYIYYSVTLTRTTKMSLSSSVGVVVKRHMDTPSGEFISRSVDIFVDGKRVRRMWCSPMPSMTGVTGMFIALCKGQTTEYVAVFDQDAVWIVNLNEPTQMHTAFPEKDPPEIEAEFNVTDLGDVLPMQKKFSNWMEYVNRKRDLLER